MLMKPKEIMEFGRDEDASRSESINEVGLGSVPEEHSANISSVLAVSVNRQDT